MKYKIYLNKTDQVLLLREYNNKKKAVKFARTIFQMHCIVARKQFPAEDYIIGTSEWTETNPYYFYKTFYIGLYKTGLQLFSVDVKMEDNE